MELEYFLDILVFAAGFAIIAIAARQIGQYFTRAELPLITGFLFTGIIAGPYMLGLISVETTEKLRFVDEISLGFIAFAAGNELYLDELKSRLRIITWITASLLICTFSFCSITVFFLSDFIPFMNEMPAAGRLAVSILAGAIMVTRSPSSAIAIINELRALGPYTQTVLGVTMILDVAVITLYAVNSSIATSLLTGLDINLRFLALFLTELTISVVLGYLLGLVLKTLLASPFESIIKAGIILLLGYGVFALSDIVREFTYTQFAYSVFLEPLLICMIGSFITTNSGKARVEFSKIIHDTGPPVYIAFFTLTGASLALNVLAQTWQIALILFAVRLLATFVATFGYGVIAGAPAKENRIGWMSFITQAGLGLGLAKQAIVEFPEWGTPFATIIIAVIVLSQVVGPPLFKWAIRAAGEAHSRAEVPAFDGILNAVIFGLEGQSLALARSLRSHGWQVKIATLKDIRHADTGDAMKNTDIEIIPISHLNLETLEKLETGQAEAVITMLSDEENHTICELAYEHFGTRTLVARLNDRANFKRFHALGVLMVDPSTAIVSLLDHFVRSPMAVSMLLGMEANQDSAEFELRNPDLHGMAIRDLRLPLDVVIISVRRRGHLLVSHGYTRLEIGDLLTIVGSSKSLEELSLRFDTNREYALLHLIESATPKELSSSLLESELKEIIREDKVELKDRFDRVVENCSVIDIPGNIKVDGLFRLIADAMADRLKIQPDHLFRLLSEREKQSSTAISPGIAIPHIIIDGESKFDILLARCKQGIHFSESNPMVHAVFALIGNQEDRNFHLRALSAIAQIVQDPYFENKWLKAKDESSLRHVVLKAKRKRHV